MFGVQLAGRLVGLLTVFVVLGACGGDSSGGAGASGEKGAARLPAADSEGGGSHPDRGGFFLGEPRKDVERLFGLYGEQGVGQFFVVEAKRPKYAERAPEIPPGYVAIGAMWADVAPMYMKSLSDGKFEQVDLSDFAPEVPNVAEFEFGPDGKAVALTFTSGDLSQYGRRPRVGDVPEEWR